MGTNIYRKCQSPAKFVTQEKSEKSRWDTESYSNKCWFGAQAWPGNIQNSKVNLSKCINFTVFKKALEIEPGS